MTSNDKLFYPTDEMASTARSLQSTLEDAWSQHNALFSTNSDSYSNLLNTIAKQQPDAGTFQHNLEQALKEHHQKFKDCYDALHELAKQIDTASQTMSQTDKDISNTFKDSSHPHQS